MVCSDCQRELWSCPTCGGLRCACPNPYQYAAILKAEDEARAEGRRKPRRPRLIHSKHYDKAGKPWPAQFIGDNLGGEEDITALIEEMFTDG